MNYLEKKAKVEGCLKWYHNWDLSLPNQMCITPSEPVNIGQAEFRSQLSTMSTRQSANIICSSF